MNSDVISTFPPAPVSSQSVDANGSEQCFHCGEVCLGETIVEGAHTFCCSGCVTVYHLLHTNGLADFYRMEGRKSPTPKGEGKYAWLDEETVPAQLLDFQSPQLSRGTFRLPSMHCAACIWLLEHLYKIQPGILRSEVDFPRKEIALDYDPSRLSLRQVVELLDTLGYPPQLSLADAEGVKRNRTDRKSWYNLGIAGFCFGNIMMMSFPEYLGIENSGLSILFNWIILGLSVPVVYSGRNYFRSAWAGLKHKHINMDLPIALGISVLFVRSTLDVISQHGHGYFDSLAGLVFFLLIGKIYQDKTYHLLSFDRDYRSYFPISITRLFEGTESEVPVSQLQAGDTILVRNGELIPADGVLINGRAELDYSFVTGESVPLPVEMGADVFAGGRQVGRSIQILLKKKVTQGYLPRLWNNEAFRKVKDAKVTELSSRIARWFTPLVLLIAAVAGAYWYTVDPSQIWNVVTSVLIVACPCALALSTPFTLGHILRILGKRGFFLKGPAVVERLADLDHIVFDKTGTLTHSNGGEIHYEGAELTTGEKQAISALVRESVHPLSRRLYAFLSMGSIPEPEDFEELSGKGLSGRVNGMQLRLGSKTWLKGKSETAGDSCVVVEIDGKIKGTFYMPQAIREGVEELVRDLGTGQKVSLVSGDDDHSRTVFQEKLPEGAQLKYRQKPEDKLKFIKGLQDRGEMVAMVGDGLNDSGALQQSDVGIAVTDELAAFTPASDGILQGNALSLLPQFLKLSKKGIRLIHFSFGISLLYNIVGLWFAVNAELSPLIAAILMPASSLSVVLFTTAGVGLAARRAFKPKTTSL